MHLHVYKALLKYAFAALFIGSGILHFVKHPVYMRLMPPALPWPHTLVYLSGVIEGGLGVLLLVPRTRRVAAWALIPTLIAVFPANIYAATTAGTAHEAMPGVPVWVAWLRLPIQGVLIAWAYFYTRPE
jgi:uncharacterized membrane protein